MRGGPTELRWPIRAGRRSLGKAGADDRAAVFAAGGSERQQVARPLRILHVFSRFDCGGAELAMLACMRRSHAERFRFGVCTLCGRPGNLAPEVVRLGGRVYPLNIRRPGFSRHFVGLLRGERFDVVHCHVHHASGFLLALAAKAGARGRIAFFHSACDGRPDRWLRRGYRALMCRAIRRYATHVLANSNSTMDSVWGRGWRADPRFRVVYLGVEPPAEEDLADRGGVGDEFGVPSTAPLYVHVGRFTEAKNHVRLLSIFEAVRRSQPDARLLLVGPAEGHIHGRVREEVQRRQLGGNVVFCGQRGDVYRLVAAADAMIFPSLWEGLGLAVVEACAAGTPVVASDLPCVVEMAKHLDGIHTLGLDCDDQRWAQRVVGVAKEHSSRQRREAVRARWLASPFRAERMAALTCGIWAAAAGHGRRRAERGG